MLSAATVASTPRELDGGCIVVPKSDAISRRKHFEEIVMIDPRRFDSLGAVQTGWLNAHHHFSFGHYYEPRRMGWGSIRVWNDDEIAPGTGFDPHPHRDMEIITYVRDGAITHRDSMGNEGRTEAGDVQVMTAGRGVIHAEYNRESELTRIFQIWIHTAEPGAEPGWDAAKFPKADRAGSFVVLASGNPEKNGGLKIRADAKVLGATLKKGQTTEHALSKGRHAYLVLAQGAAGVNGVALKARDGAAIKDEDVIRVTATEDAEVVLVDAP
jgi:redox-sensitive bicupin YhaK (pirin superfamily)